MGTATGRVERQIKPSSRGADHFNHQCDLCRQRCNGHYMAQVRTEWVREGGEVYFSGWDIRSWGHLECVQAGEFERAPVVEGKSHA